MEAMVKSGRISVLLLSIASALLLLLAGPPATASTSSDVSAGPSVDEELSSAGRAMLEANIAALPDEVAQQVPEQGSIRFYQDLDLVDVFPCVTQVWNFPPGPTSIANSCVEHEAALFSQIGGGSPILVVEPGHTWQSPTGSQLFVARLEVYP
jgi:hypothetical protein